MLTVWITYAIVLRKMNIEAYCVPISLKFVSEHKHILYGIVYEVCTCNVMIGNMITYEFCGIHYLHTTLVVTVCIASFNTGKAWVFV